MDELAEYERKVLDVLREPLESGHVSISRAARQASFPARFQLIAAMNPSPTGEIGDGRSNDQQVLRYLNRISGPLLDRIDLQVDVPKLARGFLSQSQQHRGESSKQIAIRIQQVRQKQLLRAGKLNHLLGNRELEQHCQLQQEDKLFLEQAIETLGLSIRAYHKVLKVALSISDLEQSPQVQRQHLAEALSYRAFDRLLAQVKPL